MLQMGKCHSVVCCGMVLLVEGVGWAVFKSCCRFLCLWAASGFTLKFYISCGISCRCVPASLMVCCMCLFLYRSIVLIRLLCATTYDHTREPDVQVML